MTYACLAVADGVSEVRAGCVCPVNSSDGGAGWKVGEAEIGPSEINISQVRKSKVSVPEICPTEIRVSQVRKLEVGIYCVSIVKENSREVCAQHGTTGDIRVHKVGTLKVATVPNHFFVGELFTRVCGE